MSGNNANLKSVHRMMPLIGALCRFCDMRRLITFTLLMAVGTLAGCRSSFATHVAPVLSDAILADSSGEPLIDCSTWTNNPPPVGLICRGDYLLIEFIEGAIQRRSIVMEQVVGMDGNITLLSNRVFRAAGKMRWKLEDEIKQRYEGHFEQVFVRTRA
jgi:hypothetical protein